ncbi:MAG: hypothetical protein PHH70_01785 [Candidatus Gracilibacteria bacterium]|nr:hypothetical protein [Candidatus Gracilibacteria bacterium]
MAHRIDKMHNNFNLRTQTLRFLVHRTGVRLTTVRGFRVNIFVLMYFWKSPGKSGMSRFWKKSAFLLLLLSSLSLAYAADTLPQPETMGLPFESAPAATTPIAIIISETIKYIGLLAILVISYGGILFITSVGNDEKVKHAKRTIIYALVGVLLSIVAYTIVDIINSLNV